MSQGKSPAQPDGTADAQTRDAGNGQRDQQPILTTRQGHPVHNNQALRTIGPRGPATLENYHFLEKMASFDRERIPERVVHARGFVADGTFEAYGTIGDDRPAEQLSAGWRALPHDRAVGARRPDHEPGRQPAAMRQAYPGADGLAFPAVRSGVWHARSSGAVDHTGRDAAGGGWTLTSPLASACGAEGLRQRYCQRRPMAEKVTWVMD